LCAWRLLFSKWRDAITLEKTTAVAHKEGNDQVMQAICWDVRHKLLETTTAKLNIIPISSRASMVGPFHDVCVGLWGLLLKQMHSHDFPSAHGAEIEKYIYIS
jgi:hypothetical protein